MPVTAFLPAIIAGGSALGGALIGKSASDNATEAESDAADKALAVTKEMYEQDRADATPYRNIGAYSLGQLGHLTGMPENFAAPAVAAATQPRTAIPRERPLSTIEPLSLGGRTLAALEEKKAQLAMPEAQTLRDLGATRQTASSFVRMRAPDGEEADVAAHEVPLFKAHGAQVVA